MYPVCSNVRSLAEGSSALQKNATFRVTARLFSGFLVVSALHVKYEPLPSNNQAAVSAGKSVPSSVNQATSLIEQAKRV